MKRHLVLITTLLVISGGIALAELTWEFETADEIAAWGAWNQLEYSVEGGVLKLKSTGPDPFFFPGGDWNNATWAPFSGADHPSIFMRVKTNKASTWQVYYVTEEDGTWGEAQRENFDVPEAPDFTDIAFTVERGGWQEHTVTHFRIDPGTEADVISEIDYISLEMPVSPVDVQGKLPVTWAGMKR